MITHKVRSKVFQFTCAVVSISKWRKEQNGSRAYRKGLLTNTSKYLVLRCRVIVLFFLFLGCPVIVLFNSLLGIISNVFVLFKNFRNVGMKGMYIWCDIFSLILFTEMIKPGLNRIFKLHNFNIRGDLIKL